MNFNFGDFGQHQNNNINNIQQNPFDRLQNFEIPEQILNEMNKNFEQKMKEENEKKKEEEKRIAEEKEKEMKEKEKQKVFDELDRITEESLLQIVDFCEKMNEIDYCKGLINGDIDENECCCEDSENKENKEINEQEKQEEKDSIQQFKKNIGYYTTQIENERQLDKSIEKTMTLLEDVEKTFDLVDDKLYEYEKENAMINNNIISQIIELERKKFEKEKEYYEIKKKERIAIFNGLKYGKDIGYRTNFNGQPRIKLLERMEKRWIEKWTGMRIGQPLFDSRIQKWTHNDSEFASSIENHSNLCFIIEDTENNIFGGFIDRKVERNRQINTIQNDNQREHRQIFNVDGQQFVENENGDLVLLNPVNNENENNKEKKAFVFSLRKKGRSDKPMKFPLKIDEMRNERMFLLPNENNTELFIFGQQDIIVRKKKPENVLELNDHFHHPHQNYKSSTYQQTFNYYGIEGALTGIVGNGIFDVKTIVVYEMIEKQ